jgi:ribonucleoside-diphosphate reductase alpha chain
MSSNYVDRAHTCLPSRRKALTYRLKIAGTKFYLTVGEHPPGTLIEIFIDIHKKGTLMNAMLDCVAIQTSLGLQHGVSLQTFVNFFAYTQVEPCGIVTGYNRITYGYSILDVIFRLLAIEYLPNGPVYADDTPGHGESINHL